MAKNGLKTISVGMSGTANWGCAILEKAQTKLEMGYKKKYRPTITSGGPKTKWKQSSYWINIRFLRSLINSVAVICSANLRTVEWTVQVFKQKFFKIFSSAPFSAG